jgi:hypothetical protein
MLIFFTKKNINIKNGQIKNIDCPNCGSNTNIIYNVFAKYISVLWIPFFPLNRTTTITECSLCKKTYEYLNFLPSDIKKKLQNQNQKYPFHTPLWMYTGVFVVLVFFLYCFYNIKKEEKNTSIYIKNPKVGDVYSIKISDGHFTSARVDKINNDSIYLTDNNYETDQITGIDDINVAKNYTTVKEVLTKKEIQEAYKKEKIFAIHRK